MPIIYIKHPPKKIPLQRKLMYVCHIQSLFTKRSVDRFMLYENADVSWIAILITASIGQIEFPTHPNVVLTYRTDSRLGWKVLSPSLLETAHGGFLHVDDLMKGVSTVVVTEYQKYRV